MTEEKKGRSVPIDFHEDEEEPTPPPTRPFFAASVWRVISGVAALLGIAVIILTAYGWLLSNRFMHLVDERLAQFETRLVRDYALKNDLLKLQSEMVSTREFDRAIATIQKQMDQPVPISKEADTRLKAVEQHNIEDSARILALEQVFKSKMR